MMWRYLILATITTAQWMMQTGMGQWAGSGDAAAAATTSTGSHRRHWTWRKVLMLLTECGRSWCVGQCRLGHIMMAMMGWWMDRMAIWVRLVDCRILINIIKMIPIRVVCCISMMMRQRMMMVVVRLTCQWLNIRPIIVRDVVALRIFFGRWKFRIDGSRWVGRRRRVHQKRGTHDHRTPLIIVCWSWAPNRFVCVWMNEWINIFVICSRRRFRRRQYTKQNDVIELAEWWYWGLWWWWWWWWWKTMMMLLLVLPQTVNIFCGKNLPSPLDIKLVAACSLFALDEFSAHLPFSFKF